MPRPVEVDVAVGSAGDRACFRIERMAVVDPVDFVDKVQRFVLDLLDPQGGD